MTERSDYMEDVFERLSVGNDRNCARVGDGWAVVHACKHPCHQDAVGYTGTLLQDHPEYLVAEQELDLYLNLVDMRRPLAHEFTAPIVQTAFAFIEQHIASRDVLVYCNQGLSRSPAMALLYLAKRTEVLPDTGYGRQEKRFWSGIPAFSPGVA